MLDGYRRSLEVGKAVVETLRPTELEGLDQLEEKLQLAGFPAMSLWWRKTFARFYASGRRRLVPRVGRRGGKSSSLCRVAVCEALYGRHDVPPGDLGVVAIVSVDRREAGRRIRTIKAILDAIGEPHVPIDGGVQLTRRAVAFQVFTATIAGVSGFTCIFALCDEVAKWRDADTGANPASEVLASLRPTMATQPNARLVLSSSPLGTLDAHAKAFDEGDTESQMVAYAPTWVANPTLTEAGTRADEPDEGKWRREYAAIPMEGDEESLFGAAMLTAATREGAAELPPLAGWSYVAAMDPATRGNGWTLVVATRNRESRRIIVLAREWRGTPERPLDPDVVLSEQAALLAPYGVTLVHTDQWSGDALASIARRHKLHLMQRTLTVGDKIEIYEGLQTALSDRQVELPTHAIMRADLLGVRRRVTATGMSIHLSQTPDGRHSDYAPPVAMALEAHCAQPRTVESAEEKRESAAIAKAKERWGSKPKKPYWQRGP